MSFVSLDSIERALDRAEEAVASGRGLTGTGFWRAVGELRRSRDAARRYAKRAADIDRMAFENAVRLRVPVAIGNLVLTAGLVAGLAAAGLSRTLEAPWREVMLIGGFGAVLVCSHSITHYLVGRLVGIGFTHYFIGGPPPPRPGAKTDYATYLLVSPHGRALMHASGAIVTKLLPFGFIPVAFWAGTETWTVFLLLGIGFLQIVTDVLLSTKTSDWMKVSRDLRISNETWEGKT